MQLGSVQPCLRPLLPLLGPGPERQRKGWEWMVLVAVLSLPVTTCPPRKALERAHPAQMLLQQILVSLVRELKVQHLGSLQPLHLQGGGEGSTEHALQNNLLAQTFIHLWVQKARWLHIYNHAGQDRAPQPHQEPLIGVAQSCCTQQ